MIMAAQILPTVLQQFVTLTAWGKKESGIVSTADIEYRVNGGTYVSLGAVSSTTCSDINTSGLIAVGSTIDIRLSTLEFFAIIENETDCSLATGSSDIYSFTLPAGTAGNYDIALILQGVA